MKREDRYIVIKKSDLDDAVAKRYLSKENVLLLTCFLSKYKAYRNNEKVPLEAVVVEGDWPEYEVVWKMIQARVDNTMPLTILDRLPIDVVKSVCDVMNDAARSYPGSRETPDYFVSLAHYMFYDTTGYPELKLPEPDDMVKTHIEMVKSVREAWLKNYKEDLTEDERDRDVVTPYDHLLYRDNTQRFKVSVTTTFFEGMYVRQIFDRGGHRETGVITCVHPNGVLDVTLEDGTKLRWPSRAVEPVVNPLAGARGES